MPPGKCSGLPKVKVNFHTHSNWCDGRDSPEAMALAAIEKGFDTLGFSSHAMVPSHELDWTLSAATLPAYFDAIRALAKSLAPRLRILCGVEADYVQGGSSPDRKTLAPLTFDYVIGSVHNLIAPDGALVSVDHTPEILAAGIRDHFAGSPEAFVRAYFRQQRDMITSADFDIVGHPDLVRKFNARHPFFDENASWYRDELEMTADAIAASGKLTEVNTGAIARGWLDDAYPSPAFRNLLRRRGVKFVLSSDAHVANALDCAFDRFSNAECYVTSPISREFQDDLPPALKGSSL